MKKAIFFLLIIFSLFVYRNWFIIQPLGGYDYYSYLPERLKEFTLTPYAWTNVGGNGLGSSNITSLWIDRYLETVVYLFVNKLSLDWNLVQRIFWLWPYLILAIFSPYVLLRSILPERNKNVFLPIGILVFSFNTYILMLISGGQINLAITYALAPIVLCSFINELTSSHVNGLIKKIVTAGLILALQIFFDLRMAYVTLIAIVVYFGMRIIVKPSTAYRIPYTVVSILIAALLHGFWLLPQLLVRSTSLPQGYDNPGWLSFLSWAKFSESVSLLHPNWPENIFGKTYFMRPEFLFLPLLAYGSLLFYRNSKPQILNSKQIPNSKFQIPNNTTIEQFSNKTILYFALLGLLGAFLAKGVNPPFGEIYIWLFNHFPGFIIFRDPTKFYVLIALSYTVLIPVSLMYISKWLTSIIKTSLLAHQNLIRATLISVFLAYWLFLLSPLFLGQVKGTLAKQEIPREYLALEKFLSQQKSFSRTLWLPRVYQFAYSTNDHPAISADLLLQTTDLEKIVDMLSSPQVLTNLANLSIKYIIVPDDFASQIFLTDRKYDDTLKKLVTKRLDKIPNLFQVKEFSEDLFVYLIPNTKEHFWIESNSSKQIIVNRQYTSYDRINPAKYEVKVENVKEGDILVFSEGYDKNWIAKIKNNVSTQFVISSKQHKLFNSFILPKEGSYTLEIFYEPQKYVIWGSFISILALFFCIGIYTRISFQQIKPI